MHIIYVLLISSCGVKFYNLFDKTWDGIITCTMIVSLYVHGWIVWQCYKIASNTCSHSFRKDCRGGMVRECLRDEEECGKRIRTEGAVTINLCHVGLWIIIIIVIIVPAGERVYSVLQCDDLYYTLADTIPFPSPPATVYYIYLYTA